MPHVWCHQACPQKDPCIFPSQYETAECREFVEIPNLQW